MCKPTLEHFRRTRDSRDAERYLIFKGAWKEGECGDHVKYRAPCGAQIIFPDKREMKKGTAASVIRMICIAGLGMLLAGCYIAAMMPHL